MASFPTRNNGSLVLEVTFDFHLYQVPDLYKLYKSFEVYHRYKLSWE